MGPLGPGQKARCSLAGRVSFAAWPISVTPTLGPHRSREPSHFRNLIGIDLGWSEGQVGPFAFLRTVE